MSFKTIEQVAQYRALPRCGAEELAAHLVSAPVSGGIAFARKREHSEKDEARQSILDLFMPEVWPGQLSMLTLPGVEWEFEKKLLHRREGKWHLKAEPDCTDFTCIENDRAIYHGAVFSMPGLSHQWSVLAQLPGTPFSERGMFNSWIGAFYFGNVDDIMACGTHSFDAAWLDYTGPMSVVRLAKIRKFFEHNIRSTLIITSLKARWNLETSGRVSRAGGVNKWLAKSLGGEVLHDLEYQDGHSPMAQLALRK